MWRKFYKAAKIMAWMWCWMSLLKGIVDCYMRKVSGLGEHCDRCLRTERWGGSVVLMVVDAAFTSIGLNYFTAVVPKVEEFSQKFVETGTVKNLRALAEADLDVLRKVWRNSRSWVAAKGVAAVFKLIGLATF